jgi:Na+/H+ antiporter NhaC
MKITALIIFIFLLSIPFIILVGFGVMLKDWWKGEEQVASEERASQEAVETGLWKFLIIIMIIGTAIYLS